MEDKKGNLMLGEAQEGQESDSMVNDWEEKIEGYAYCSTSQQKCLTDCNGTPMITTIH